RSRQALRGLLFFVSRLALHLTCRNRSRREARPQSLLSASKSPDDGYLLTLMHSNKTVYSSGRYYIYVGGRLRLAAADGIGNNQPGAKSFHDCRSDHMSLVRLLWSGFYGPSFMVFEN